MIDKKKPPYILHGGPRHKWNDAESNKRREYADHHEETTITIHDIIQHYHVDLGKVANLIVNGALEIKGFTTKFWPFPEDVVEAQETRERIGRIIEDLKILLMSRKELQDTTPIDFEILDLLLEAFFERKQFVDALTSDPSESPANKENDAKNDDEIIRNVQVGVESDDTLKIRLPGRPSESFTNNSFWLRRQSKAWRELVEIISSDPPLFRTGSSSERQTYDKRRKMMDNINEKLIKFFNTHFSLELSQDFNFFEAAKDKGPGVFRFKLRTFPNINDDIIFKKMSNDKLRKEIYRLSDEQVFQKENTELNDRLGDALSEAFERGILTEEEIKEIVQ